MPSLLHNTLRRLGAALAAATALGAGSAALASDILFTSNREGGVFRLYTMAADGSGVRRATGEPLEASEFALSPDRSQAVFASTRQGRPDLLILDLASGRVRPLTDDAALEMTPVWSPDGRQIVFLSYRTGAGQLHIVNADGSGLRRLTDTTGDESQPVFSPDGSKVVYTVRLARREANLRTVDLRSGQSTVIGLDPAKGVEVEPQWSPDGKRLAFVVMTGDATNVHVMNADGSERRALTSSEGYDRNNAPQWSADGRTLLFLGLRKPSTRQAIYTVQADGSGLRELIGGDEEHLLARWTPDGKGLVFVRFHRGSGQIFSALPDGSGIRRISDGRAYDADFAIPGSLQPTRTSSAATSAHTPR